MGKCNPTINLKFVSWNFQNRHVNYFWQSHKGCYHNSIKSTHTKHYERLLLAAVGLVGSFIVLGGQALKGFYQASLLPWQSTTGNYCNSRKQGAWCMIKARKAMQWMSGNHTVPKNQLIWIRQVPLAGGGVSPSVSNKLQHMLWIMHSIPLLLYQW